MRRKHGFERLKISSLIVLQIRHQEPAHIVPRSAASFPPNLPREARRGGGKRLTDKALVHDWTPRWPAVVSTFLMMMNFYRAGFDKPTFCHTPCRPCQLAIMSACDRRHGSTVKSLFSGDVEPLTDAA
jgi:hypothetical protein